MLLGSCQPTDYGAFNLDHTFDLGQNRATKKATHGLFLILDFCLFSCLGGGLMASAFSLRSRKA